MSLSIILFDLKQVRGYTNDMLDHVDDAMWFRQPSSGINHIAWQAGHLAIVQYHLCLKRIRGERPADTSLLPVAEYAHLFGKGSTPSPDAAIYPSPQEIRGVLDSVHARVLEETANIDESVLSESAGPAHPMFTTKGEALRFCPKHEMLHVGQIGLLRRLFDGAILR